MTGHCADTNMACFKFKEIFINCFTFVGFTNGKLLVLTDGCFKLTFKEDGSLVLEEQINCFTGFDLEKLQYSEL